MDRIRIGGLIVATRVGVPEEERAAPQDVRVDLELGLDLAPAGASDRIEDTIDYGVLTERIAVLVGGMEVKLLERIAERIAEVVLGLGRVARVTVEVAKLHPPVERTVDEIAVRIERSRR